MDIHYFVVGGRFGVLDAAKATKRRCQPNPPSRCPGFLIFSIGV
jgi:hypothetical protein